MKLFFTKRLHNFDVDEAKTAAPFFKSLPDKLSIPAPFSWLVFLSNLKTLSLEVDKNVNF